MQIAAGVVLVAAGSGERFGRPKASVRLAGKPLLEWSAAAFEGFSDRVVVLRPDDLETTALPGWKAVPGGARRRDSVAAGLAALDPGTDAVLIHDAARPLVTAALVRRVAEALAGSGAVVPGVPVSDTIKRVDGSRVVETPDRAALVAVQTPQGYRCDLLRRALEASDADATDEAGLVEALGEKVTVVPGDPANLKITREIDLEFAEILARRGENR
jgi:2-C-methyl-D-erythritol 4-phosphate cytidylyltransferase